ncbi:hypothetical protein DL93DRAFT_2150266 [Clavulina sp. PMI_390]|nr:hypothetical protein DL93DRAFT_2150266 [Clavulina sp. PMI_390]
MEGDRIASSSFARRAEFKLPPSTRPVSQEERRARALEDQKRKRALRVNASRNISLLGSLTLGTEDDDDDDNEDDDGRPPEIVQESLKDYVSMLQPEPSSSLEAAEMNPAHGSKKKHRGGKKKKKGRAATNSPSAPKTSRFANVPMFAELLELRDDDVKTWDISSEDMMPRVGGAEPGQSAARRQFLPSDLETGWVALAPIPAGKRCLAVSHQHHGTSSRFEVTSTHLHSRLKGSRLLKFPSGLPPDSILDCILDLNWQENGIIHVLDIIRWRGADFGDCEAEFRFWWRDARISEIVALPPLRRRRKKNGPVGPLLFDYPITFLPVPYCNPPIPLTAYLTNVIQQARLVREIPVTVFKNEPATQADTMDGGEAGGEPDMEVDQSAADSEHDVFGNPMPKVDESMAVDDGAPEMTTLAARVETDGLLLYVSEASYQPVCSSAHSIIKHHLSLHVSDRARPLFHVGYLLIRFLAKNTGQRCWIYSRS